MARFIIHVLSRAFGDALLRHGDGARHIHFPHTRSLSPINPCGKRVDGDMLIDNRDDGQRSGETKTVANFIRYQRKGVVSPIKICEAFKGHLCRPIRH